MSSNRREFIRNTIVAGSAAALGLGTGKSALAGQPGRQDDAILRSDRAPHPLKILILGGTSFLGPHQIAYALKRGHSVSIFTRGRTQPTIHTDLFKHVEHLIGDRSDNLEALKGRTWDVVIDNSGYSRDWTRDSAQLLKDHVNMYVYTSSIGVYYPYLGTNLTEDTELVMEVPPNLTPVRKMEYDYGVMKTLSEIEVTEAFGQDRSILVRPTYIIGPGDRSNRFPYWPARLERGGEVFVPGKGMDPIQIIDVRDLTEWMIRLLEIGNAGTFNAAGPASRLGMHAFVHGVHAATSSAVEWIMVPDYDFLTEHEVFDLVPWIMPTGDNVGSALANIQHAVANGLTFRPLAETSMDTLKWWHSDAVTEERRQKMISGPGSFMSREVDLIAAWKAHSAG